MRSAVGLITRNDLIVLVKRNQRTGDPWSGDIAFPGGHVKDGETPQEGVLREIAEEVNLNLSPESIIFAMEPTFSMKMPDMPVYPFVLKVDSFNGIAPGPEISQVNVVSLSDRKDSRNPVNGMPAYDFQGWIVWGLTYRILKDYISLRENSGVLP